MKQQTFDPAKDAQRWDRLPTISFKNWLHGSDNQKQEVAGALYDGATGPGFFYLVDHGIDQSLIDAAYVSSRAFHASTNAYKENYNINKSLIHRGWVSRAETLGYQKDGMTFNNFHESFDLSFDLPADDPSASKGYGLIGPNVWPDLKGFRTNVSRYYDAIHALGRELMAAFETSLALKPGTFLDHVTAPPSQLRLLKYFENDAPIDKQNAGIEAHSDYECFTILNTSGPGLQLMSYDNHWVEAPPVQGTFVVNIGDCLEAWTGGLFKATQHRVLNLGKERYSLPMFFAADYDTEIKPLSPFSTEDSRRRYPPFIAGEHLWGRTIQTFPYLKRKYDAGKFTLDFVPPEENPFKRFSLEEREAQVNPTNAKSEPQA
ncbi:MAG: isopenicillin N synthase-like dioxygenase [Candidatus Azotimanducaceae bacterium]|jgi:isopenicillin N synthase-like dioxygenase